MHSKIIAYIGVELLKLRKVIKNKDPQAGPQYPLVLNVNYV